MGFRRTVAVVSTGLCPGRRRSLGQPVAVLARIDPRGCLMRPEGWHRQSRDAYRLTSLGGGHTLRAWMHRRLPRTRRQSSAGTHTPSGWPTRTSRRTGHSSTPRISCRSSTRCCVRITWTACPSVRRLGGMDSVARPSIWWTRRSALRDCSGSCRDGLDPRGPARSPRRWRSSSAPSGARTPAWTWPLSRRPQPRDSASRCILGPFAGWCSREARERRVVPGAAWTFLTAADPAQTRYEQARSLALGGTRVAAPDWRRWLHVRGSSLVISGETEDPAWAPRAERREQRLGRVLQMLLTDAPTTGVETAAAAEATVCAASISVESRPAHHGERGRSTGIGRVQRAATGASLTADGMRTPSATGSSRHHPGPAEAGCDRSRPDQSGRGAIRSPTAGDEARDCGQGVSAAAGS